MCGSVRDERTICKVSFAPKYDMALVFVSDSGSCSKFLAVARRMGPMNTLFMYWTRAATSRFGYRMCSFIQAHSDGHWMGWRPVSIPYAAAAAAKASP